MAARPLASAAAAVACWPSFRFEAGESEGATCNRLVMVAVDATRRFEGRALRWALEHVVHEGDGLVLLGVIHTVKNPMGYKTQASTTGFNGTNDVVLKHAIKIKLDEYHHALLPKFSNLCAQKKAHIDVVVRAGWPLKFIVATEALNLKVASIILDSHLKKDMNFYLDCLLSTCNVILMKGNGKEGDKIYGKERKAQQVEEFGNINGIQDNIRSLRIHMSLEEISHIPIGFESNNQNVCQHKRGESLHYLSKQLHATLGRINDKILKSPYSHSHPKSWRIHKSDPTSRATPPRSDLLMGGPWRWKPSLVPSSTSIDGLSSSISLESF